LETFGYEYDRNSQIIEETRVNSLPEEAKRINETTSYTYDNFGRLTRSAKTEHQDGKKYPLKAFDDEFYRLNQNDIVTKKIREYARTNIDQCEYGALDERNIIK
jgi:hypothetical protein